MIEEAKPSDYHCGKVSSEKEGVQQRTVLALYPGPLKGGERAWYTLFAHAPLP